MMKKQNEPLSTAFILTMRYQSTVVPLADVCEHFLPHINLTTAKQKAIEQSLPFPAFKTDNSKKANYFVRISDLAMWLDCAAERAASEWQKVNS